MKDLDIDYAPAPDFRVIQLTPEGSSTSIQLGVGLTDTPAGPVRGLYLVVPDIEACWSELTDRGVTVSEIRRKDTDGGWRGVFHPGVDPDRADYARFADFGEPDGIAWVVHECGHGRLQAAAANAGNAYGPDCDLVEVCQIAI